MSPENAQVHLDSLGGVENNSTIGGKLKYSISLTSGEKNRFIRNWQYILQNKEPQGSIVMQYIFQFSMSLNRQQNNANQRAGTKLTRSVT